MKEREIDVEAFLTVQEWRRAEGIWDRRKLEARFYDKLLDKWPERHSGNGHIGIIACMEEYDAEY